MCVFLFVQPTSSICMEYASHFYEHISGWPRFGSVRLRFGDGTVRAVPVFGSGGSSEEGFFFLCFGTSLKESTVPVPVSVPGKRFRRFRFRFRFRKKRF